MTIDFWGLGLQAVNVLILVWLLSRVFWRPVADAIARRQDAASALMEKAHAAQVDADAAVAEAINERAGIAAERTAILDAARNDAVIASKTALSEARARADAMLAATKVTIEQDTIDAQKANEVHASDLSLKIAARLLERLNGPVVQAAFLSQLVEAITKMPATDRATILADPKVIQIVSAPKTGPDTGSQQEKIRSAVHVALGGTPDLQFVTDPNLIGGLELRSPHLVLHNSWRADLSIVRKAVKDAA